MMLLSTFTTITYLILWCTTGHAFPTPGTNPRDPFWGLDFEQTTSRSRQTTTIDYDLADFDEFGNDPGMYDVAGSPDATNLVDDNDQGLDNQPGMDTGQSLFEPMYTVLPGVSKSPVNSGEISSEVQQNTVNHREGGPSDEGTYTNANQKSGIVNKEMVNNFKKMQQDTDKDVDGNNQQDNRKEDNENTIKAKQSTSETQGTQPEEESSSSQRNMGLSPDSNDKDKYDANGKKASHETSRAQEGNGVKESRRSETISSLSVKEDGQMQKTSEKKPSTENSGRVSEATSGSDLSNGVSREFSDTLGSYTAQDFNSQEFSAGSSAQSNKPSEIIYINSGEVSREELNYNLVVNGRSNEKSSYGASTEYNQGDSINSKEQDPTKSKHSSNENSQLSRSDETISESSSEKTERQSVTSSSENESQSSFKENNSKSSSDENQPLSSSDEKGSTETSGETGFQSPSDENVSESTSYETVTSDSDENASQSLSDENISKSSEKSDSLLSSSVINHDNDNDTDFDPDTDNDDNLTGSDVNTSEGEHSNKDDKPASVQKGTTGGVSDSAEEKSVAEKPHASKPDLANCFISSMEDGKHCYLLRSLYTLCKGHFKQECMSSLDKSKSGANEKANSKALDQSSPNDASAESVEEPFHDSAESATPDGSSTSPSSKLDSMSYETVESLSASFERSRGIFEVIDLIQDACQSICALAESRSVEGNTGSDVDMNSSESSDEDDWIEVSDEMFTDSDEDQSKSLNFPEGMSSEDSTRNIVINENDVSGTGSGEYSIERNSNEDLTEDSFGSVLSTESFNSADLSGDHSFEYNSMASENTSD